MSDAIASDSDALLAELVETFLERRRRGECLSVESFAAAHPELGDELPELLRAVEEMDSISHESHPPAPVLASYPDRLGDYCLLERLGSGGMGTVFRAMQESLKREVAVKILAPAWNADARHSEAFENESRLIAGLRHTNIVEVYGAGQEGNYRYYVMELIRGRGLSAGQLDRSFPGQSHEKAVAWVGLQAAKALAFAHAHGVLHRDVKPGNLLLDDEGVVHVSDFGLATALNAGEAAPLVTQSLDGTLRYMAPERLMKGVNSYAGDQYSLGLTLYELITRTPAFSCSEPGKLIHTICHESVQALRDRGELGAIINKAVSYDEADRYPNMRAMADDLQCYLEGRPVAARPASALRRYLLWLRRRPAVAVWSHAAALLVLLLFASICWGYINVSQSLRSENEQRRIAEENARIADAALLRIFTGLGCGAQGAFADAGEERLFAGNVPSAADAGLMRDLLPYYEEIAAQAEQGDSKVIRACRILADISLQVEDYPTAETYYRRVYEAEPRHSLLGMEAANGLASALYGQGRAKEAREFLEQHLGGVKDDAPFDVRLAAVHSMQLAAGFGAAPHGAPPPPREMRQPEGKQGNASRKNRPFKGVGHRRMMSETSRRWLKRAANMLAALLQEKPNDPTVHLRRVELLSAMRHAGERRILAPNGESPLALLAPLLEQYPDNKEYRLAYLRLSLHEPHRNATEQNLKTAAEFAGKLLADRPGDSERIMLYLSARDRYAAALAKQGKTQESARENERTLGVLEHLTARADFSPELREKLIALVAHRPPMTGSDAQRDAELSTLLHNYDEKRLSTLRRMLRHRPSAPPGSAHRNPRPPHRAPTP